MRIVALTALIGAFAYHFFVLYARGFLADPLENPLWMWWWTAGREPINVVAGAVMGAVVGTLIHLVKTPASPAPPTPQPLPDSAIISAPAEPRK